MKKFVSILLAFVLVLSLAVSLAACGEPEEELSEIEKVIQAAEAMTLDELIAAAKAEIGSNTLKVSGITSGLTRAAEAFAKEFGIACEASTTPNKDYQQYEAIAAALDANEYYADVVLAQDANALKDQIVQGNFLNYLPKGFTDLAEYDKEPLAGVYFNKLFIYTASGDQPDLYNVWQLAGSAADKGHISNLSFQNPTGESINMNFLIMLTSESSCAMLKSAYKSFYGKDYVEDAAYKNIGYKFAAEFIANVSVWHTSDTTAVKNVGSGVIAPGTIVYAPLAKYKDAEKETPGSTAGFTTAGLNSEVEGFNGFMYKMYLQVLKTSKYPYTACLFINYLTTSEAFEAGWRGEMGYYSVNSSAKIAAGDQSLAYWKTKLIIEDGEYIYNVYDDVNKFIKAEVAKTQQ